MNSSSEELNKLWVLSHLLFPNASQARDFFRILTTDLAKKINLKSAADFRLDTNTFKVVSKLYLQIKTIPSSSSFAVFPEPVIKSWSGYTAKCTKEEILITLGVIYLKLNLTDIAKLKNKSESEIRLKFNRSILSFFPLPVDEDDVLNQISSDNVVFKKFDEKRENKFFIRENLVGYIFENMPAEVISRIEVFLNKNRKYLDCVKNIKSFKSEIEVLTLTDLSSLDRPFEEPKAARKFSFLKSQTLWSVTGIVALFIVGVLIWRPEFVKNFFLNDSNKILEMQEIKIARAEIDSDEPVSGAIKKSLEIPMDKSADKLSSLNRHKESESPQNAAQKKELGQLYRAVLFVNDIEQVSELIKEKIVLLGGKKAGEVELGWMKNKNLSYYHFTFPKDNQTQLESYLNQFGTTDFKIEKHARIMPQGTVRYILEIKLNE